MLVAGLLLLASGCASIPEEQRVEHDRWESFNRPVYDLTIAVDKATTKPLAKGYQKVVPTPVRRGISNFLRNLTTPGSAVNNFLQGKPRQGFSEAGRFVFNSTLGVAGIFDIATAGGMEEYPEDFGQTLAVWGAPAGPYVMLPFLGPHTFRDVVALPFDYATSARYYIDDSSVRDPLLVTRIIDTRTRLLVTDKLLEDSKDPYVTTREAYLQNREFQVYDGDPPEDDDFFDDIEDY